MIKTTEPNLRAAVSEAAFSILEVMIAAGILVVAVSGLYALYSASLAELNAASHAAVVQANLQTRLDSLKNLGWADVTDTSVISTLLASPITSTKANLPSIDSETISAYPIAIPAISGSSLAASGTSAYFTVTRTGSATATPTITGSTIDVSGSATNAPLQINYHVSMLWTTGGRQHTREISGIISQSGSP